MAWLTGFNFHCGANKMRSVVCGQPNMLLIGFLIGDYWPTYSHGKHLNVC